MTPRRPRYDAVKRGLDILGSGVGLVVLSPLLLVVACLVAARLGRPVMFAQERPGRGGRVFRIRKFRSMLPLDEGVGRVADADRLTPFGRRLRATSLDELPALWNVFRGDMSVVGPRPLLVAYLDRYTPEQARRHDVRPGITGLAQVNGRNAISWEERLRYDVEYVDTRSFSVDARILGRTMGTVLHRRGISEDGSATMSEFQGEAGEG